MNFVATPRFFRGRIEAIALGVEQGVLALMLTLPRLAVVSTMNSQA